MHLALLLTLGLLLPAPSIAAEAASNLSEDTELLEVRYVRSTRLAALGLGVAVVSLPLNSLVFEAGWYSNGPDVSRRHWWVWTSIGAGVVAGPLLMGVSLHYAQQELVRAGGSPTRLVRSTWWLSGVALAACAVPLLWEGTHPEAGWALAADLTTLASIGLGTAQMVSHRRTRRGLMDAGVAVVPGPQGLSVVGRL